jgi:dTDP-glucose pyrophosphorylase
MWQTILTAAGDDDLVFQQAGFRSPKNWVRYKAKSILESAILSYSAPDGLTKVILRQVESSDWQKHASQLSSRNIKALFLDCPTQGALCTALLGLDDFDPDAPLVVGPGDSFVSEGVTSLVEEFLDGQATAATLLFSGDDERYSYARLMPDGDISEMAEKRRISTWASTGIFIFRRARDFIDAGSWVLQQNMRTGDEFYMSSSFNYLVMRGDKVLGLKLPATNKYVRLASPFDLLEGSNL